MVWMVLTVLMMVLFLVVMYCALVVASDADDQIEAEAERHMTDVIPIPVEPKVTYPVPLDQDLQDYIVKTCLEYEISPCVVFAIIGVESSYNPNLIGDNGSSYRLMQIYAAQHTQRCVRLNTYNLLDPRQNVLTGIDYLAELLATGHSIEWCLSWYNGHGGEPCEYARTVMCNAEQILEGVIVDDGKSTGAAT